MNFPGSHLKPREILAFELLKVIMTTEGKDHYYPADLAVKRAFEFADRFIKETTP